MDICPTTNKSGFASARAAWKNLHLQEKRKTTRTHKSKRRPMSVFRCAHCGQWHTTSQTKAEQSPRRIKAAINALRT